MNNFLSTKQSVRILTVQENIQSKVGTSTCPEKTCSRAYGDFALDFTNPGLIYARFLHFVPNKDQNIMKLSCNCRIIWRGSRKRELSRAVPQSSKGRLSCVTAPRGRDQSQKDGVRHGGAAGLMSLFHQIWTFPSLRTPSPSVIKCLKPKWRGGQLCKRMTKREKATSSS